MYIIFGLALERRQEEGEGEGDNATLSSFSLSLLLRLGPTSFFFARLALVFVF